MSDGMSNLDHAREAQFTCDTCGTSYTDRGLLVYGTCKGCGETWCQVDLDEAEFAPRLGHDPIKCVGCDEYFHRGCMTEGADEELRCKSCAKALTDKE